MSFPLPNVNLAGLTVGQGGTLSLAQIGGNSGASAHPSFTGSNAGYLYLHNESGSGLTCSFRLSGQGFKLPAGAWLPVPIPPGEINLDFTVDYVLPNPPVTLLMCTYYVPGEKIPPSFALGNSPIGIGGSVTTQGVQTLSNEGQTAGTLVVDIGPSGHNQITEVWNDHGIIQAVQSGVVHQILKWQTSGTPLQIGQSGDITEVLSTTLALDHSLNVNANLNFLNNSAVARLFAAINSATNDPTIWTSADNGLLHIRNSGSTSDIATFADSSLLTTLLGMLVLNSGSQQVTNGSVAGTCTFYTPIWGSGLKVLIVFENGYNSANIASFTFPSTLTTWWFFTGNMGTQTWDMFNGGVAQQQQELTALGTATATGTFSGGTTGIKSGTIGTDRGNVATSIQIGSTGGAAHGAILLVVGV